MEEQRMRNRIRARHLTFRLKEDIKSTKMDSERLRRFITNLRELSSVQQQEMDLIRQERVEQKKKHEEELAQERERQEQLARVARENELTEQLAQEKKQEQLAQLAREKELTEQLAQEKKQEQLARERELKENSEPLKLSPLTYVEYETVILYKDSQFHFLTAQLKGGVEANLEEYDPYLFPGVVVDDPKTREMLDNILEQTDLSKMTEELELELEKFEAMSRAEAVEGASGASEGVEKQFHKNYENKMVLALERISRNLRFKLELVQSYKKHMDEFPKQHRIMELELIRKNNLRGSVSLPNIHVEFSEPELTTVE